MRIPIGFSVTPKIIFSSTVWAWLRLDTQPRIEANPMITRSEAYW